MASKNRGRLGDLGIGNGSTPADPTSGMSMPPPIGSTYSNNNWNSRNIWGSTIGSGLKANPNELNRPPNKGAPFGNGEPVPGQVVGGMENSEEITGSGSLLSSSESEGWARRGSLQWPPMAGGLNGLANPHVRSSASPVRARTNQHTRSNSPFSNGQLPAMGAANGKASRTGFDPRSQSFNPSAAPFANPGFDGADMTGAPDHPGQRQNASFGAIGGQGYSGYASSAASRSGSLPPSRHGNEPGAQLGDLTLQSLQNNNSDIFAHRPNQQSRNNFSNPALNRLGVDPTWGPTLSDLTSDMDRVEMENDGGAFMQNQGIPPSPGSVNGAFNAFSFSRNGSISYDQDMRGPQQAFNQYRMPYGDRANHSPNGSETRRSHDSPIYFSGTPPVFDQYNNRVPSNPSSRANGAAAHYNQAALERKLRNLAEQQAYTTQPSPVVSFRQPFYNDYNATPQQMARMNPNYQSYNGMPNIGGFQSQHTPTGRMPPRGPASTDAQSQSLRSPILEEFRQSKGTKRYELKDIYEHVVEFSGDQHGSRFIQQKLETANSDEKAQLFTEILPNAWQLMTDVFGNYVIQKFFEHGNQTQKKQLADKMKGHIPHLSLQMYGCRVVQKAFEHILVDQQAILVAELENQVLKCVKDQNGNHVVQKAIERIPAEHIPFIIDAFNGQVQTLATHPYGCRVVQRLLEHCPESARAGILEELHACALNLIVDQYGNYVAQHVIEHGRPEDRLKLINLTLKQLIVYSRHKFASNVVERCIRFGTDENRHTIVSTITSVDSAGNTHLNQLMQHEYGNYVIQKLLKTLHGEEYDRFVDTLQPALTRARQFSYGKQIGQIDKLVDSLKAHKKASMSSASGTSTPGTMNAASGTSTPGGANAPGGADATAQPPNETAAAPSIKSATPTPPPPIDDAQSPLSGSQPSTNASSTDGPTGAEQADAKATPILAEANSAATAAEVATPKPTAT